MTEVHLLIPDNCGRGAITPRPEAFLDLRLAGETMGTNWSARWFSPLSVREGDVAAALEHSFTTVIASMSTWQAESLISRYNDLPPGQTIEIDAPFAEVMAHALDIARRSKGAFDPCLGREVRRRGFGPSVLEKHRQSFYGESAWCQILPASSVLMQPGGVVLELSAIAKGYAVDQMARTLETFGVTQFLVEIGGEFVARGVRSDGMPWWVDIENPYPGGAPWRVALVGKALATSGDYRQRRQEGSETVSHIVPAAGRANDGGDLASVSVIHPQCAIADGWATALFAAGDRDGLAMADAEGLAALFQYRNAPPRLSAEMQKFAG
ncbi:MAG: FAD:protein FMN transferase [Hyphomonas sp.]